MNIPAGCSKRPQRAKQAEVEVKVELNKTLAISALA
jgi:hypothetical protein